MQTVYILSLIVLYATIYGAVISAPLFLRKDVEQDSQAD